VLGVRPTWDGLLFDPCLPAGWTHARLHRPWRGAVLHVEIRREAGVDPARPRVSVDGVVLGGRMLTEGRPGSGQPVEVRVACA
jgi:cellobiose phosphorylase